MIDAVIARIRAFRRAQGWTKARYATAAGLRESTIRMMDAPGWSPTTKTIRRLEAVIPRDFADSRNQTDEEPEDA